MPMGLAVDPAGNVYVADTGNLVVRILRPFLSAAPLD
jgi:DNA-binding beta-propeller fold protein YncE